MSTALVYITRAFENLNVFQPGVTIPAAQSAQALAMLNLMMSTWAQQLTPAVVSATFVPLVAGKRFYSWGPGSDITSPRPPNQNSITGASLVLNTSVPFVEVPLAILTDDMYQAVKIKLLESTQPTAIYYNALEGGPGIATGIGNLTLWPVPDNSVNSLLIYHQSSFGPFADLSTTVYTFPQGYDEAIIYNLERRLSGPYGREMPAEDAILARETFANIMRSNQRLSDLPNDFALAFGPAGRGGYNIQTGNY